MTVTALDYLWFQQRFPELATAYCITLVKDLMPSELLHRLAGREQLARTGVDALVSAAVAWGDSRGDVPQLVGMSRVGAWTLMIEPNGALGVTEEIAGPASAGTRWISHYHNVNDVDSFFDYADTMPQSLIFDPVLGATPDEVTATLQRMGFRLGGEPSGADLSAAAAFALAEKLTGVQLTPALLEWRTFVCGVCPPPPVRRVWPGELRS